MSIKSSKKFAVLLKKKKLQHFQNLLKSKAAIFFSKMSNFVEDFIYICVELLTEISGDLKNWKKVKF